jgi:hypothetical protein
MSMSSSPGTSAFAADRGYGGNKNKFFSSFQITVAAAPLSLTLLAYSPYLEKIKVDLCDHHAVCVSTPSTFECLNQSLRNFVYIIWHRSLSQRHTYKSPSSVCASVCVC